MCNVYSVALRDNPVKVRDPIPVRDPHSVALCDSSVKVRDPIPVRDPHSVALRDSTEKSREPIPAAEVLSSRQQTWQHKHRGTAACQLLLLLLCLSGRRNKPGKTKRCFVKTVETHWQRKQRMMCQKRTVHGLPLLISWGRENSPKEWRRWRLSH